MSHIASLRLLIKRWRRMADGYQQNDNWLKADQLRSCADELEAAFPETRDPQIPAALNSTINPKRSLEL